MSNEYCQGDSGKIIYKNVQEAFNAIINQNKRRSRTGKSKVVKPYRCDICSGIHIGTSNTRPHPRDY